MELQDEALLYLRDNITREEAYYILTTDKEMLAILIADKKDGSKRIKILDVEYTIEKDDMLFLFDTDGVIDECLLVASYIGVNMYFRRQDVNAILNNINREKVMKYPYIAIQLDNKSIKDSGFRSMSDVISYANNMVGDKPIDHIRVSNEARGWCGSYTNYGKMID